MTKEKLKTLIGQNIRKERITRGMSIEELAGVMGLSTSFIGLMERGQRGVTAFNVFKLSEIFGISIEKFFELPTLPGQQRRLSVADLDPDTAAKQKRSKLNSLMHNLTEQEIEFMIVIVKNLKALRPAVVDDDSEKDED